MFSVVQYIGVTIAWVLLSIFILLVLSTQSQAQLAATTITDVKRLDPEVTDRNVVRWEIYFSATVFDFNARTRRLNPPLSNYFEVTGAPAGTRLTQIKNSGTKYTLTLRNNRGSTALNTFSGPLTLAWRGRTGLLGMSNRRDIDPTFPADAELTYRLDHTGPIPTITSSRRAVNTWNNPFDVTVEFDEEVRGFTLNDFKVTFGMASRLRTDIPNRKYTIAVTPTRGAGKDLTLTIPAGLVTDTLFNRSLAATPVTVIWDDVRPQVSIIDESPTNPIPAAVNNTNSFTVKINFDELVTGFELADLNVTHGSATSLNPITAGRDYIATITPNGGGDIIVEVPAGAVDDIAGNQNRAVSRTVLYDTTPPTATLSGAPARDSSPFDVRVTFSEPIRNFNASDLEVTNGTVSNLVATTAGRDYTATITPDSGKDITLRVRANAAQDDAGNGNPASAAVTVIWDANPPTTSITAPAAVNGPFDVTVTFSKNVTGFRATDLNVTDGRATRVTGSGAVYRVRVAPDGTTDLTLNVAADVAQDGAGNGNEAAAEVVVRYDTRQPTTSITAPAAASGPFDVTVTFDKDVTGFDDVLADFTVTNGTVDSITGSDKVYTVRVTPNGMGGLTLNVPADVAQDAAGNGNQAAAPETIIYDTTSPTTTITTNPAAVSNSTRFIFVSVTFSEPVTGFGRDELIVKNGRKRGTLRRRPGGRVYIQRILATGRGGDIELEVAANVAQDDAGNGNLAAAPATVTWDTKRPTPTITGAPATVGVRAPFDVTVTFDEPVRPGFTASDLTVTNGAASNLRVTKADEEYRITVTPDGSGNNLTLSVAADVIKDRAGNDNQASRPVTITWRATPPTVAITRITRVDAVGAPQPEVNTGNTAYWTVDFSDTVYDLNATGMPIPLSTSDALNYFSVTGAPLGSNFSASKRNSRKFVFILRNLNNFSGDLTLTGPSPGLIDNMSNPIDPTLPAGAEVTYQFDNVGPTPTITGAPEAVNRASTFVVTVEFDEPVRNFGMGSLGRTGANVLRFTPISSEKYEFQITTRPGLDTVLTVPANVAVDIPHNNPSVAAIPVTVRWDVTAPGVAITSAPPVRGIPFDVTVTFSESVTGFVASDLTVTNGTPSNLRGPTPAPGGGETYTITVTPDGKGNMMLSIPANVAEDAATNRNTATRRSTTVTYDGDRPTATIIGAPAAVNNTNPFDVTVTFSEAVTGFAASDLTVTNGDATNVTAVSGTDYTVEITPDGNGPIEVRVLADAAIDDGGNGNQAAGPETIIYDTTQPTVTITGAPAAVNNTNPFNVTVTFSESVTGFGAAGLDVTNGAATNVSGSGTDYMVEITPDGGSPIEVRVKADAAQDDAGNGNQAAGPETIIYDATRPTVTITGAPGTVNNTNPFDVTVTFSESVTDFDDLTDITVTNGAATNVSGSGTDYMVEITPDGGSPIEVRVKADAAQDDAGNGNQAAGPEIIIYDATQPTVTITGAPAAINSTTSFNVTVTFDENVNDFTRSDVDVGNGRVTNFIGSGAVYRVEITPYGGADVVLSIPANAATDDAGNLSQATAGTTTVTWDVTQPTVGITAPMRVNGAFDVTVTFDKDVTGFGAAGLDVTNGAATNVSGSGTDYMVEITPDGGSPIEVRVKADAAQDDAGNGNQAAGPEIIIYDATQPTVTITGAPGTVNNTNPFDVTVRFSESVTGFGAAGLDVTNGAATNVSGSGTDYMVEITPDGGSPIEVRVKADAAQDDAGNGNQAAGPEIIIYDATQPTVTITGAPRTVNNTNPFNVTVRFSESVTGFGAAGLDVTNGAATNVSGSGTDYMVEITPDGGSPIEVRVKADAAQDDAGNGNQAAGPEIIIYDATQPTVTITGAPRTVNNTNPFNVTVRFSESVTGFGAAGLDVTNGAATNVSGSGTDYMVEITPDGGSPIEVRVKADAARDRALNGNQAAGPETIIYDATRPTVTITGAPAAAGGPFDVTVTFSEPVIDFDDLTDITVTNGDATKVTAVSRTNYTVQITPNGSGTDLTLSIAANVAEDDAGNGNQATGPETIIYDTTQPTVTITGAPAAVNNTNPFNVTVTFSESVTGFGAAGLDVTNGAATNVSGSGTDYMVEITPDGGSPIEVRVKADAAQDDAGNGNQAAGPEIIIYDATRPTVTITGAPAAVNNTNPFNVTVTFSESVTGFGAAGLDVTNGAATNVSGSGTDYTATITPDGGSPIEVRVKADAAQDDAGNGNQAAGPETIIYDTTQPTVTITGAPGTVNNTNPFDVTVRFSESVTGFGAAGLDVTNGAATNVSGSGTDYTATITPDGGSPIEVRVKADAAQDDAGNGNQAAGPEIIIYDTTQPTVTITGAPGTVNNTNPFDVTVTFSESVTGFGVAGLDVTNGAATNVSGSGTDYMVEITPDGSGTDLTLSIAANVAEDRAKNGNQATGPETIIYDATRPTVTITGAPAAVNNTNPFDVTVTFSESVTGFGAAGLDVTNGAATNVSGSGTDYMVEITPDGGSPIEVRVKADAARDRALNGNQAAGPETIIYDATRPTVTITGAPAAVNNTNPFNVTVTFSESVTGFGAAGLDVTNGAATNVSGSGTDYMVEITPDGSGADLTLSIAANVAEDRAKNGNQATGPETIIYDTTQPTVTITGAPAAVNNTNPFDVTVTFSESVTGFGAAGLDVTNGAATNVSGSGTDYMVEITPDGGSPIEVRVKADAARDRALNGNQAAGPETIIYDATRPTVTITGAPAAAGGPFDVTVTFSEPVIDFDDLTDITVTNGDATKVTAVSRTNYTVQITPNGSGTDLTLSIAANVAEDRAKNGNQATGPETIIYDATRPTVTITGAPAAVNNTNPFDVTVTFSESVTGFGAAGLDVTNGAATNVSGSGTDYMVEITPDGGSPIEVRVKADAARDRALNGNQAAGPETIIYDATRPTVTITGAPAAVNNTNPFNVTVTFSESVTGFGAAGLDVTNGAATNVSGSGTDYMVEITPDGSGADLTLSIAANVAEDRAKNGNQATGPETIIYDTTQPTVTITGAPAAVNNTNPFDVTVTFSESVTGFGAAGLDVTNGAATNVSGSGTDYMVEITPDGGSPIEVRVKADAARDRALNGNQAAGPETIIYDATRPTVTITGAPAAAGGPFDVTVTFSEPVIDFDDLTDITVTNGDATKVTAVSRTNYTVQITPNGSGTDLTLSIAANVAEDDAGNGNQAAGPKTVIWDTGRPTVSITAPAATAGPFDATVTFSKNVTGFVATDLNVTNARATRVNGSGAFYSVHITPDGSGADLTLSIAANVAEDRAKNGNQATGPKTVTWDAIQPQVTITAPDAAGGPFDVTVTFSEEVTGFAATDLDVTNGEPSDNLRPLSATDYTITVTPDGSGADLTLSVAANVAQDGARNGNQAAPPVTVTWEDNNPAVNPVAPTLNLLGSMVGIQVSDLIAIRIESDLIRGFNGQVAGHNIQPCHPDPDSTAGRCTYAALPRDVPLSSLLDGFATAKKTTQSLGSLENAGEMLAGTSSSYVATTDSGSEIALWGQGNWQRFSEIESNIDLKGQVYGFALAADYQKNNRLFGLMLSRSHSDIKYRHLDSNTGPVASQGRAIGNITALIPYASMRFWERLRGWAAFGLGWGSLRLKPEESPTRRTAVGWQMAATGLQGAVIEPSDESSFGLDVTADFLYTRTSSDAISATQSLPGYAAAVGKTNRLRFGLNNRWEHNFWSDKTLTPHAGLALRRDGGNDETGWGLEVEAGIRAADPSRGLDLSLSGHSIAVHQKHNFQNQGLRLSLTLDPSPNSQQGFSIRMQHGFGALFTEGHKQLLASQKFPNLDGTKGGSLHRWAMQTAYGYQLGWNRVDSPYLELSGSDSGMMNQIRTGYHIHAQIPYDLSFELYQQQDFKNDENSAGFNLGLRW